MKGGRTHHLVNGCVFNNFVRSSLSPRGFFSAKAWLFVSLSRERWHRWESSFHLIKPCDPFYLLLSSMSPPAQPPLLRPAGGPEIYAVVIEAVVAVGVAVARLRQHYNSSSGGGGSGSSGSSSSSNVKLQSFNLFDPSSGNAHLPGGSGCSCLSYVLDLQLHQAPCHQILEDD